MKSLNSFIVRVEKRYEDEIETEGGLKLYVDTKFEPFKHRINEGEVVATPAKFETGVEVGDTLYFHHLVVLADGQPLPIADDHYFVRYNPDIALDSQAIAYKSKATGDVVPLSSWSVLKHVEQEPEVDSSVIEVVKLKEPPVKKAEVAMESDKTKEIGVKKGDIVGIMKNSDYPFKVDGETYYRTRVMDLMYVEK